MSLHEYEGLYEVLETEIFRSVHLNSIFLVNVGYSVAPSSTLIHYYFTLHCQVSYRQTTYLMHIY